MLQDLTFAVFNIESKADNVIGLEVSIANLIHSLKGLTMSESIQFRLAKRGEAAYLNIEAQVRKERTASMALV